MTLLTVFYRRVGLNRELVFASDSRLGGNGQRMDYGQKLFETPRSDALVAWAGDTQYAYPLMMQMLRAIEGYPNSVDRRLPLPRLAGHTLRVFQQTYDAIHGYENWTSQPDPPDNFFLLGGFDWQAKDFRAWGVVFNGARGKFEYRRVIRADGYQFHFAGDNAVAVKQATHHTLRLLRQRGKRTTEIDMEPFEALCEIIEDTDRVYDSIGGAPQLGKVYEHLNTQLFQVLWDAPKEPTSEDPSTFRTVGHVAGRPLLPNERCVLPLYDRQRGFWTPWGDRLRAPHMGDAVSNDAMDEERDLPTAEVRVDADVPGAAEQGEPTDRTLTGADPGRRRRR